MEPKIKTQKIPRASQQNPQKSLDQKLAPKKPHTEFLNLKNFQKALNDITRKIKTLEIESLFLFLDHTIRSYHTRALPRILRLF